MFPYALHAYRTTTRTSTGATSYSLVYRMEAEIPLLKGAELDESEWEKLRFKQLNLINEKKLTTIFHHQLYQSRMTKAYNKKVKSRVFKEEDLILKKISLVSEEDQSN